ncbi:MAG: hypothetical protein ACRDHS_04925 [Actinomycetota bacterium]
MISPEERLDLAKRELGKAQVAAIEPVDWLDVALYSFYALENAVAAAADNLGVSWKRSHASKVEASELLRDRFSFPDVADLLQDLNELRKSESYGEIRPPHGRTAEDIVTEVEDYVQYVESRLNS